MTAIYDNVHTLHRLTSEFRHRVTHPYVQRFIPEPVLNPLQAGVLLNVLEGKQLNEDQRVSTALAALLVQTAMDIHDEIGNIEVTNEADRKQRQLTVLAGDYLSSLYYTILAESGDPDFISVFSASVQEINEAKMRMKYSTSMREAFPHYITARSSLAVHTAASCGQSSLAPAIRQLFLLQAAAGEVTDVLFEDVQPLVAAQRENMLSAAYFRFKSEAAEAGESVPGFLMYEAERLRTLVEHRSG
ncbi:heptaprenyl diphosphate synthase component 1 [Alkalicoccus chagannorensis]|uniref:heptaprenyl diphosphate synthase component 1 n=1 Tax=Alkalicoccus chagannorensis TaxID=427072 RepID=UPI0003FF2A9C|nr:heptaprenyl diphosphate synthase component 1 [Alkalicoccus chagannorensis]